MLLDKPLICCNKKPKLGRKKIGAEMYFYYFCLKCGNYTFSTREEEYCRELWNARIIRDKNNTNL